MKIRLLVGLVIGGLMAVMLSGPVAAKPSVERFLGPGFSGHCVTLETDGDRARIGHAKARYTDDGQVEARLHMRNLAPNQLHRVLLHQEGDPRDPGFCWFLDVHYFTTDSRGRIDITVTEPMVPGSLGMFVTVYGADATTDFEAFSNYPFYGTEAIDAPK